MYRGSPLVAFHQRSESSNDGDVSLCVPNHQGYDGGCALADGRNRPDWDHLPSGRMSLLDMMNFSYFAFSTAVHLVAQDLGYASYVLSQENAPPLDDAQRALIRNHVEYLAHKCVDLLLERSVARLSRIMFMMNRNYSRSELAQELEILLQAIDDDIQFEYFFHYRRDRGVLFLTWRGEWGSTISAFPSAASEIEEGIDCFGLEHNAACVFHMTRVAELGMRSLARERRVAFPNHPLEWAEWENVIDQIDSKARAATTGMSRGPERDAARAFYTAAVAQLRSFKETRNRIMHMRGSFDELDARRAINQVRDFMNGLSAKIGEKTKTPIRRWP